MKHTSLPRAFVRETAKPIKENFNLDKWFRKSLDKNSVPYFNDCCDNIEDKVRMPVVWNTEENQFEYWDPTTKEYVPIVLE